VKYVVALFCSVLSAATPALQDRAKPYLDAARAAGMDFVSVNAASGMPNLAADSLATALGSNLAPGVNTATAPPYSTILGEISVQVVDCTGIGRLAQLLYVSSSQINYLIPAGTATGLATVTISNQTGKVLSSQSIIQPVAPGLFTANADGQGVVAATAYHTIAPSSLAFPVPVFQCGSTPGSCVSVPLQLGVDTPLFVTFYTTGLRGRSSDAGLTVTIGGQQVQVRSISAQDDSGSLAGVDLVLVGIPLSLRGNGEVDVLLSVDGRTSNTGRISIQ
jgi:uncharacterized protein (TIGR03437 family)